MQQEIEQERRAAVSPAENRIPTHLIDALAEGRLHDPFSLLGPHQVGRRLQIRTWQPGALRVQAIGLRGGLLADFTQVDARGMFVGTPARMRLGQAYRLRIWWPDASGNETVFETEDPYSFGLLLSEHELGLLSGGVHYRLGRCLGAQPMTVNGVAGTRFAVWAPSAQRVSVVGDFNLWDGRRHPMRLRHEAGVWELFIPRIGVGERYKYELLSATGHLLPQKADPVARATEVPPSTASVVAPLQVHVWNDEAWMASRASRDTPDTPISIYEMHAGSWQRDAGESNRSLSWDELGDRLTAWPPFTWLLITITEGKLKIIVCNHKKVHRPKKNSHFLIGQFRPLSFLFFFFFFLLLLFFFLNLLKVCKMQVSYTLIRPPFR